MGYMYPVEISMGYMNPREISMGCMYPIEIHGILVARGDIHGIHVKLGSIFWTSRGPSRGHFGVDPELVSEVLVVIFGIYAKNAVEWWYRESLGRSVSLFPSTTVNPEH